MLSVLRATLTPRVAFVARAQTCHVSSYRRLSLSQTCAGPAPGRSAAQRSVMAGATSQDGISYLTQKDAVALDEDLMGPLGFFVDQLMELAGLSVACAVAAEAAAPARVLVLAGPGNNGGDGLVAARHLHHFGYDVEICYPKPTNKPLYDGLVVQCKSLQLPFIEVDQFLESSFSCGQYGVIIDSLFGFSFKGAPRPPFDKILEKISESSKVAEGPLVASVDIPSGWNVETGPGGVEGGALLKPNMLISLTTPKLCARFFEGEHHYLGGRFVPPEIREKYKLRLPPYPGTAMCVKLPPAGETAAYTQSSELSKVNNTQKPAVTEMGRHVADDDCVLDDAAANEDPMALFEKWFSEAAKDDKAANTVTLATVSPSSQPAARMVLMKGFDAQGFTIYTNYNSRKAAEMDGAQKAALCFYWKHLNRSVRVEGPVARISGTESDEYFATRPRGSQLGAWTSAQSTEIPNREVLRDEYARLDKEYEGVDPIPRPPYWGGYRIKPRLIEFWHDQASRMHDRLQFTRTDESSAWTVKRLSP